MTFELLLGHLIGDFLLQPRKMAIRKSSSSAVCALHCTIYSVVVWLFVGGPWWVLFAVGIPHFVIDRWSLAAVWMWVTRTGDFFEVKANFAGDPDLANFYQPSFVSIIYVVTDQTMHALCLWALFSFGL